MPKTMTSKERVRTTLARQEPDRVPVNYFGNSAIDRRLKEHYGLDASDDEGLRRALGVDFRTLETPHIGPKLHADVPGRNVDIWGIRTRWIEHESGGYWEFCDFPLRDATLEEVEAWPMPSADHFDYSTIAEWCERYKDYCIVGGRAGLGDIINSAGFFRSMEQVLVDLLTDNPAGLRLIDRRMELLLEYTNRILEAGKGRIDMLWLGEDLGTQKSPMISLELFRKHIRPRHQKFVDLGKACNLPVMIHSCGSSSWAYDDFIEMGINVVDTLQPEAVNMAPAYLKQRFGHRLAFHGCISTAGPLAYGTVQDVVDDVQKTLEIMMPGGGYALAPTHCIQDNTPTENAVAMYEAARKFGQYY